MVWNSGAGSMETMLSQHLYTLRQLVETVVT